MYQAGLWAQPWLHKQATTNQGLNLFGPRMVRGKVDEGNGCLQDLVEK